MLSLPMSLQATHDTSPTQCQCTHYCLYIQTLNPTNLLSFFFSELASIPIMYLLLLMFNKIRTLIKILTLSYMKPFPILLRFIQMFSLLHQLHNFFLSPAPFSQHFILIIVKLNDF